MLNGEERSLNDESNINSEQTISGLDASKEQNINKRKSFGSVDNKTVTRIFKKARHTQYDTTKDLAVKKQNLNTTEINACDAFGKYIASELKTFDSFSRAQITHVFNNVLYEAHMGKFKQHITQQQSILNWNQNGTSETLVHPFTRQQFHLQSTTQQDIHNIPPGVLLQQSSPQQYPSPTPSIMQQSSPQRYPTSSMTHHPDHDDINKMFIPQLKVYYSSDSSVSSHCPGFTD